GLDTREQASQEVSSARLEATLIIERSLQSLSRLRQNRSPPRLPGDGSVMQGHRLFLHILRGCEGRKTLHANAQNKHKNHQARTHRKDCLRSYLEQPSTEHWTHDQGQAEHRLIPAEQPTGHLFGACAGQERLQGWGNDPGSKGKDKQECDECPQRWKS